MNKDKALKYLEIARATALLSKDTSTQVGAIIVGGAAHEVRSLGYNGAPRNCDADMDERSERPEKYYWFSHAELNAITNAARVGTPLDGCTLIVTHFPCMDCARAIVQVGIKEVWVPEPEAGFFKRWREHVSRAMVLFAECKVKVNWL